MVSCAVAKAGKIRAICKLFAISTYTWIRCTVVDIGAFEASSLPSWIAIAFVGALRIGTCCLLVASKGVSTLVDIFAADLRCKLKGNNKKQKFESMMR